jgi:hypothetical protein
MEEHGVEADDGRNVSGSAILFVGGIKAPHIYGDRMPAQEICDRTIPPASSGLSHSGRGMGASRPPSAKCTNADLRYIRNIFYADVTLQENPT